MSVIDTNQHYFTTKTNKETVIMTNIDETLYNLDYPDNYKLEEYMEKRYSSDFHANILGRLSNRNDGNLRNKIAEIYKINDDILRDLFKQHPTNTPDDIEYVYFKVKLLNDFYSTGINDIYTITEGITKIKNLDTLLANGDIKAIDRIREMAKEKIGRDIYSFATKYCHFSNSEKFSIYDKYVAYLLRDYMREHKEDFYEVFDSYNKNATASDIIDVNKIKSGQLLDAMRNDYQFFMNVIDLFISKCKNCNENSRRNVDNYLWLAGMMKYRTARLIFLAFFSYKCPFSVP